MIINDCYHYQKPITFFKSFMGANELPCIGSNLTQIAKEIKSKPILPFGLLSFKSVKETMRNSATSVHQLQKRNCCLSKNPEPINQFILGFTALFMSLSYINSFTKSKSKSNSAPPCFLFPFSFWSVLSFLNLKMR